MKLQFPICRIKISGAAYTQLTLNQSCSSKVGLGLVEHFFRQRRIIIKDIVESDVCHYPITGVFSIRIFGNHKEYKVILIRGKLCFMQNFPNVTHYHFQDFYKRAQVRNVEFFHTTDLANGKILKMCLLHETICNQFQFLLKMFIVRQRQPRDNLRDGQISGCGHIKNSMVRCF